MKKMLFFTLFIGICMSGAASTKEKNPVLLKQVFKKEELIKYFKITAKSWFCCFFVEKTRILW